MQKFIRYTAKYFNKEKNREETGIFRAADYVKDFSKIEEAKKEELRKLVEWFDNNLPVPEFYDDPAKRSEDQHTYFWFKITANEFIEKMDAFVLSLKENGINVEILTTEEVSGKIVFEDHCQIAVVPFEDVFKVK